MAQICFREIYVQWMHIHVEGAAEIMYKSEPHSR